MTWELGAPQPKPRPLKDWSPLLGDSLRKGSYD